MPEDAAGGAELEHEPFPDSPTGLYSPLSSPLLCQLVYGLSVTAVYWRTS